MKNYCNYCDPKHFVVYGFCKNCKRKCNPPLYEPKSTMSAIDYQEYCRRWDSDRADTVSDAIRRDER